MASLTGRPVMELVMAPEISLEHESAAAQRCSCFLSSGNVEQGLPPFLTIKVKLRVRLEGQA